MPSALEFAQSITDDEIDYISTFDRDQDIDIHKSSLRTLIFDQNCVISDDQFWYPFECVEMTRWRCDQGHEREFTICHIIIFLSTIAGTCVTHDPDDMMITHASEYDKLSKPLRELVLNCLHEASKIYKSG